MWWGNWPPLTLALSYRGRGGEGFREVALPLRLASPNCGTTCGELAPFSETYLAHTKPSRILLDAKLLDVLKYLTKGLPRGGA